MTDMNDQASFAALHSHGFVRVAAATPLVATADPLANAAATIALAEQGDADGVDLIVYPELGISSYAIDDLHLQDALLDGVVAALGQVVEASRDLTPVLLGSLRRPTREARAGWRAYLGGIRAGLREAPGGRRRLRWATIARMTRAGRPPVV